MKSTKARELVKTMEKDYNAHNKMINSTVAHQAIQMAEMELTQKAIEAFKESCPCWSRFQQDRKCDECAYLKDFCNQLD